MNSPVPPPPPPQRPSGPPKPPVRPQPVKVRAEATFNSALERPAAEREAFIAEACGGGAMNSNRDDQITEAPAPGGTPWRAITAAISKFEVRPLRTQMKILKCILLFVLAGIAGSGCASKSDSLIDPAPNSAIHSAPATRGGSMYDRPWRHKDSERERMYERTWRESDEEWHRNYGY